MNFPLAYGLREIGLPLILTSGEGKFKDICFLIDTGSTHNALFDYVYEHFKDDFKLLSAEQPTMGIEGNYKSSPVIEATFNFEGQEYTSTFSVLDASLAVENVQKETGFQLHGILGVQFFIENKWIIDFEKYEVYSRMKNGDAEN